MKKTVSILLSLLLLLTTLPFGAVSVTAATSGVTDNGLEYTISNGEVTITHFDQSIHSLYIPDVIEGFPVTTLGDEIFWSIHLSEIHIPKSVSSISPIAFIGSSWWMTAIYVDDDNPHFCDVDGVLFDKNKTTLLRVPADYNGFRKDNSYTIPDSVTVIAENAFANCGSASATFTFLTIPSSVTTIGEKAFSDCTSLTSVTIPDSVTSIGDYAFNWCTSLTDVYYGGTENDRNNVAIGSSNAPLLNATWHYTCTHTYDHAYDADCNGCGAIREAAVLPIAFDGNSVSQDVSGLAFLFGVDAIGMSTIGTTAVYDNATVDGYRLVSMGAVASNGKCETDIKANVLWSFDDTSASFAVRIINIPTANYDTEITATPYVVLIIDGVETTVYGEPQTATVNANLSK